MQSKKLNQLVQDKREGIGGKRYSKWRQIHNYGKQYEEIGDVKQKINITSMKVYNGQEDKEERQSKRTTNSNCERSTL
jgi:hypothetical protein